MRLGRLLAFAVGLTALVVYLNTLAPSITWKHNGADSGDLVTAAYTLGIPHPPGYPLYTLLAAVFARIPFFEPAAGVGIMSALAAALAVILLARAGAALIKPFAANRFTVLIPPLGALIFALAPALWAQATIAEVYTLNLFFVCAIFWTMVTDHPRRVFIAALAFGFGMAHHLAILLAAPGAWIALKPSRKNWRALLVLLAPLALYAYLPLRASQAPAINWGDPSTLEGFVYVVTAAPYRSYLFGISPVDMLARFATSARLLLEQFTVAGIAIGLWGAVRLYLTHARSLLAFGLTFALSVAYAVVYASRDSFIYLLPAFAIVALFMMYGAADILEVLERPIWSAAMVLLLLALVFFNLVFNLPAMDLSEDREAYNFARAILERLPHDAVIFAEGDEHLFALQYYRHAILAERSSAVIVAQGLLPEPWYYRNLTRAMYEVTFAPIEQLKDYHERAVEIAKVTFAEGRAVCFTKSSPLLPEFEYEQRGDVQCVIGEKQ